MPSRYWLPLPGIDPTCVRLEHIHAAVSSWFDLSDAEHAAVAKPYAVSPLAVGADGRPGLEIRTLISEADERLWRATTPGAVMRLGTQCHRVCRPSELEAVSWEALTQPPHHRAWQVELQTPTTFRVGSRTSPLPNLGTILENLARNWEAWADFPTPNLRDTKGKTYISDLNIHSRTVELPAGRSRGRRKTIVASGSVGQLVVRASTHEAAVAMGAFLRLAPYTGIGSFVRKGLGVVATAPVERVRSVDPPVPAQRAESMEADGLAG